MTHVHLRTLRERRGLTQQELAEKSGVKQNTISKAETRAQARPSFETHMALAKALKIAPERLKFGPDPKTGTAARRRRPTSTKEVRASA